MNTIKKLLLPIICLWAFIPYGIGQNENPDKKKLSFKHFYNVEANFGISACQEMRDWDKDRERVGWYYPNPNYKLHEKAKFAYQTLVYGVNFAGGIELAYYLKAGFGIGYLYYKQYDTSIPFNLFAIPNSITTHGIPLFLYLRSDFFDKKTTPYLDFKIGDILLITKETVDVYDREQNAIRWDYGKFRVKNGLFLASNLGFAFKRKTKTTINLSLGYKYISRNHDLKYPIDERIRQLEYRKTGFITADHQFVINLGASF